MTATLQLQAQQTITDSVLKNTHLLIEALKDNFREYSIRGHQRSVERNESVEHHQQRIDELRNGILPIDYVIESGKKYHKIIMVDGGSSQFSSCFRG
jgi:hypothetical protein